MPDGCADYWRSTGYGRIDDSGGQHMTIDIREAYRRALDDFGALVHRIAPGQWENPTPCAGWDVRTLVNHVVSESLCVPELFAGRSAAEIGGAFDGDLL